ncbi:glycosyltransferase family 9 protein [Hyalangium gracile]|uniref:glycosyltransferase family 9 protein n=1 Tax=Hyalangium gracile TaxID=394092 RepID=UPI001CCCC2B2|nr:glycosyltransferase family 9 protein [Hyalangium gracile]
MIDSSFAAVRSILVIRAGVLGDVVMATSVLEPLRRRFPHARIEWAVDAPYAPLLRGLPEVSQVHALRRGAAFAAQCSELAGRFDLAIDLHNKLRTRLLAFVAAERRLVLVRRSPLQTLQSVLGRDVIFNDVPQVELYAGVLRPLGGDGRPGPLRLAPSEHAREQARKKLGAARGLGVAIAPGTRWATKRWPVERFAAVADALHADGWPIALLGGPDERELLAKFRATTRAPLAADLSSLSLDEVAAALAEVRLLIGCDSGPMHIATAVGTPGLAIFGPTSAVRWGPPPPSQVLSLGLDCSPCSNYGTAECPLGHHRCMKELTVDQVVESARALLARTAPREPRQP